MHTGTVRWFNARRGFGFIGDENGTDYFVHYSEIQPEHEGDFRTLKDGMAVTFEEGTDENGRPMAKNVKRAA